jgi:F-type H+-transporting ATPase subunit alpha
MSTDSTAFSPLSRQADWLDKYDFRLRMAEQGRVVSVGDGIAWVEGLPSAAMDEVLRFDDGSRGLVFHLGSERVGAILLSQGSGQQGLTAGTAAFLSGRNLEIGVGDGYLGRVVDPMGMPLDGGEAIQTRRRSPRAISSIGPWFPAARWSIR